MSIREQEQGIISLRPIVYWTNNSGSSGEKLGILSEDGIPFPEELDTEEVRSSDGAIVADVVREGDNTFELQFVSYSKHTLSKVLSQFFSEDGANTTDVTDPLKGNLLRTADVGVAPRGILVIKNQYIDVNANKITYSNSDLEDNSMDFIFFNVACIGKSETSMTNNQRFGMSLTFRYYPDKDNRLYANGKGIDVSTMTYTTP